MDWCGMIYSINSKKKISLFDKMNEIISWVLQEYKENLYITNLNYERIEWSIPFF